MLKGQGQITEINVAALKEVRRALLEADVSFNTAKAYQPSKRKSIRTNVLNSISPSATCKITQEGSLS